MVIAITCSDGNLCYPNIPHEQLHLCMLFTANVDSSTQCARYEATSVEGLGPESYDRDLQYRHRLHKMTIL